MTRGFDELRLELTNALTSGESAEILIESIRQDSGWMDGFSYREQTILAGIYGDLLAVQYGDEDDD